MPIRAAIDVPAGAIDEAGLRAGQKRHEFGHENRIAEFADGKWGACAAELADVLDTPCPQLWARLRASGRLEHAPVLDMSRFR